MEPLIGLIARNISDKCSASVAMSASDEGPSSRAGLEGVNTEPVHFHAAPVPMPYSSRQFDRSASFTSLERSIELASGRTMRCSDDSSDSDEEASDGVRGPEQERDQSWAVPYGVFEVEEPSTETTFVMRSLREALTKKENECEHLRQIIKELSESRARVHRHKVDLEESYTQLQKEYLRVVKVSELARTVSQQSITRCNAMRKELQATCDAASRAARRGAAAHDKARRLKAQNAELRQRAALLESLVARVGAAEGLAASACMREFLRSTQEGLY